MKKQAKDVKKGDSVSISGKKWIVETVELSDIGKQGSKKARFELKSDSGEKIAIIRPEEYPMDVI